MKVVLDPRTSLGLTLLYAGIVAASSDLVWLSIEVGALLVAVAAMGQARAYARWLRGAGVTVLAWFAISWWASDLLTAVHAGLRLLGMFTAFFLFFRTTPPEDLGNALVKMGLPYEVAFVFSTAMQFVPVLSRKAQQVTDAQRARGIPLEPGLRALRYYPALFVPLLVQAFQLADELAEAMETRGFSRPGRTFLREYRLRVADWVALASMALLFAAVVLAQRG